MFERLNRLFPVWAILFAILAAWQPDWFTSLAGQIKLLLAIIMFAMGLTLSRHDFLGVLRAPLPVAVGVVLQFTVMPVAALAVSWTLGLDAALTTGMVLVGATAGGTASNVMTWLAGGHVALSVSMTLVSTLISVVATPLLTWLLVGQSVEVPVAGMFMSIAQLVIAPIALGVVIHHFLGQQIRRVEPLLATVAMAAIVLIIAIVVGLNAGRLATLGPLVALAVVLHNAIGLAGGYGVGRLLGFDQKVARTIAIEVGMQNSGLAVALANQFFSATAALPGALFSVWHNVSGSLLAGYWKRRPVADAEGGARPVAD
ncbi:bile acid:sodium symporter family protein [Halomonas sp. McH1-25]|nr:bile acid:sodium symporter family protein [Halomonas sp. McH1-25]MCP1341870.1 bile acid:sodium symporter family protein [Halomonas sp. FL8]MCP1360135.1 bile acid:sodium symporter family protein [Halomonas sp. BBD45]MCP1365357.1 bile acid:sodium symporter family protein [Halomonas sp. BBD48]